MSWHPWGKTNWPGFALIRLLCLVGLSSAITLGMPWPNNVKPGDLLAQAQPTNPRQTEADRWFVQGIEQYQGNQFEAALRSWQQALEIYRQVNNRQAEGNTLANLGLLYETLGDYDKALEVLQQSLVIARAVNNREGEGITLGNLGNIYYRLGSYSQAIDYHQQSLAIAREVNNREGEGLSLGNLGFVYDTLGNYSQAIDYHRQSLAIAREIKNRYRERLALGNLGLAYDALGDYKQALSYQQQSLAIAQELRDRRGEANTLSALGNLSYGLGEYRQALDYQQRSLAIAREINDRQAISVALTNLGMAYASLGNYGQAIEIYQQSLALAQQLRDRQGESKALGNLGIEYAALGDYQKALEYHQQGLVIAQELGDRRSVSQILGNLGNTYFDLGDYQKAIQYQQRSLAIAQAIQDRRGEGQSLGALGNTYRQLGNYQKAIETYQQRLAIARTVKDRPGEAKVLNNLGLAYDALGEHQKAIELYRQSLAIAKEIQDPLGEGIVSNNLGLVLFHSKQLAESETALRRSITVFESLRQNLQDAQKVSIADTQRNPYDTLQQVLIAQNKIELALEIAERGRARAFAELLAQRTERNVTSVIQPIQITAIQQVAREQKATLVEYSNIDDRQLLIWVVKPTGEVAFRRVDLEPLRQQKTSLNNLVAVARCLGMPNCEASVASRGSDLVVFNTAESDRQFRQLSAPTVKNEHFQRLHQVLIQPIADLLPTDPDAQVIFIPQGRLFLLPFALLQDEQGKYLIEQHTIAIAPSIQVLQLTRQQRQQRPAASGNVLLVGNPTMPRVTYKSGEQGTLLPLPGAETEARAIATLLNSPALVGKQATETAVRKQLPQARIIHLATHGLLDDLGAGVPGAIALAPDNQHDGLLTASELLTLDLQAELVVLSACDTGRGRITGDGVIGLSRSLITAGVPSVVVSLWAVPDAPTADLMTRFYQHLNRGQNKAQALRQAMLETKQEYPDPLAWAAFTLIGERE